MKGRAPLRGLIPDEETRPFISRRLGSVAQLAGARRVVLTDGVSAGVDVVEVATGSGLRFEVLAGRGMDIGRAEYAGLPLTWRSAAGEVAAGLHDPAAVGWLRSFHGGLLCGCGLRNAGPPADLPDQRVGLHGRLSTTPAESVAVESGWRDGRFRIRVSGTVREAGLFAENLTLRRTVETELGARELTVEDVVENEGFRRSPHMFLYHMNFGWPLVDAGSRVVLPALRTTPRDETAAAGLDAWATVPEPQPAWAEQVFFHELASRVDGEVRCGIARTSPPALGVELRFSARDFPWFVQWKMAGEGEYVVALEPANCLVEGFEAERAAGRLTYLEPGEQRTYRLAVRVLDGQEELDALRNAVAATTGAATLAES